MKVRKYISQLFRQKNKPSLSPSEKDFRQKINQLLGCKVNDIGIYIEAFCFKTKTCKTTQQHERLEFLGDAVLGSIISSHLYKVYQNGNEGYLTQMKSKIVSRENLNQIGEDLNLKKLMKPNKKIILSAHISGNLLEAFIGAIYLDLGYEACHQLVLGRLFTLDKINRLENKIVSYKSVVLEWGQKNKYQFSFETQKEKHAKENNYFRCDLLLNGDKIANASEFSKKKAEEKAAQRAFYALNKKYKILETN